MTQSGLRWGTKINLERVTRRFVSYARFGIKDSSIGQLDWSKPDVPMSLGLLRQRVLDHPTLRINPAIVKTGFIAKVGRFQDRVLKNIVWELARLYPEQIACFINRMRQEKKFRSLALQNI